MGKSSASNSKSRSSLARKLIFLVGLVIVALNVLQLLFVTTNAKKQILAEDTDMYENMLQGYALALQNDIESYFKELNGYVHADVMEDGDLEACYEWIMDPEHRDMRGDFDYVMLSGSDGQARTDLGGITSVADRDYFQAIMQKGAERFVDDPVVGKTTGLPVIHVTRALKDRNGRTFAMLSGVVNVNRITAEINKIKIGENGYGFLLASDGKVIAHPEKSFVMEKNFITGIDRNGRNADMIDVAVSMTRRESGNAWINANARSGKDLIVYVPVEGTPWSFALSVPDVQIYDLVDAIRNLLILFAVVIVVALCAIIAALLVVTLKPLSVVESTITGIASGDADLTRRIEVNSNNEIGRVVDGFNQFSEKLQTIIATMKDSKRELVDAGEMLSDSTTDTSAAITQIIANIESMSSNISMQSDSVHQTAGAVNEIAANIESLNHMIESQASSVTEASAAVEEMIGNINSVNNSVRKMADAFEDLELKTQTGIQKQNDVNARIAEIEAESQSLQEANAVISGIAEQTNLLAMNAAIEAAHAGEAGKGFSVVADEIRKLSEDSGSQSQTIGEQLSRITATISEIVGATRLAAESFSSVSEGIYSTHNLVHEITNAMQEQNAGSQQIQVALHNMNDTSNEVRTSSYEMAEGNKAILNEVKSLQDATFAIKDGMEEMSAGARKINETGAALSELSRRMDDSIQKIGEQVDQFRV